MAIMTFSIVQTYSTNKLVDIIPDELSVYLLKKPTPFPQDEPLSGWVDLYQNCEYKNYYVDLCNKDNHPEWTIGN